MEERLKMSTLREQFKSMLEMPENDLIQLEEKLYSTLVERSIDYALMDDYLLAKNRLEDAFREWDACKNALIYRGITLAEKVITDERIKEGMKTRGIQLQKD